MKTGLSSNLFHALQFTACRPSHNAHDHGADSKEHEVQKASSTLYRAGGCGVNGQRLRLAHLIDTVKVNHMGSKTTCFSGEREWSGRAKQLLLRDQSCAISTHCRCRQTTTLGQDDRRQQQHIPC